VVLGERMLVYRERGKMLEILPGALEMVLSQKSSRVCWGGLSEGDGSGGGEAAREGGRDP